MNEPPYDFNQSGIDEYLRDRRRPASNDPPEPVYVDPVIRERATQTSQTLRRYFLILLAIGLGLGGIMAAGLAIALHRLGLADRPGVDYPLPRSTPSPPAANDGI